MARAARDRASSCPTSRRVSRGWGKPSSRSVSTISTGLALRGGIAASLHLFEAEAAGDLFPDGLGHGLLRLAGIDYGTAVGVALGDIEKPLAQPLMELCIEFLEARFIWSALVCALKTLLDGQVQDQCEVWLEVVQHHAFDAAD